MHKLGDRKEITITVSEERGVSDAVACDEGIANAISEE